MKGRGTHGRSDRRALGAVLALALCLSLAVAWPAAANIGGVFPTDEDGGTAIEVIASNQNLFAYALTDVQGGDICMKPAAAVNPGNGSLNCLDPAWGTPNRVMGIGSSWTLIQAPYLRAGHWKLLADGGSKESVDVFSNDFWVLPCEPDACDRRLALLTAQRYKNAAAAMAASMRGISWTLRILEEVAPDEPFDHVNVINEALRSKLEDDPLFKRVVADKITRKLQFVTQIPSGPHSMALAIAHQVSADALEMYLDIVADPPAPYDTVAQPEFDVPQASTGDADLDGLMLDIAQLAGYGAAGRKAFERYQQAAADDNDVGVHRQAAAMGRFDGSLTSEMWSTAAGLDRWAARLDADPAYGGATVGQAQVDELKAIAARVRASGLTAEERQGFADSGLDAAAIDALEDTLGEDDFDAVAVGTPVGQLLREAAAELREQAPVFDELTSEAEAVAQTTGSPPVASFTATPASGSPPLKVTFHDTSTDADGDPLTVSWDFGDGSPAVEGADVEHTFAAGTYEVTQTVSDGVTTSTATRTIKAGGNDPPTADAGPDLEGTENDVVGFDASGSADSDGSIASYRWDFGDGTDEETVTSPVTGHAFGSHGTYTVHLVVTDDDGATDEDTATVTVANAAPRVTVGAFPRASVGATRPYAAEVRTGATEPSTVSVDFGDGSAPAEREVTGTSTPSFDHAYQAAGEYHVSFEVTDSAGETATGEQTVLVADPVAVAGPDVAAKEGDTVKLGGASTPPDPYTSVTWDFGDGSQPGVGVEPEHVYRDDGTYTATVTVKDDAKTVSDEVKVTVANLPPVPGLTIPGDAEPGAPVGMRGFARDPGVDDHQTFTWKFGDGATGSGARVKHAYAAAGTYTVEVRADDGDGGVATKQGTVVVGAPRGRRDNRGKDFWLSFPTNYSAEPALTLFIAAETATSGTVEVPGLAWSDHFSVTPGEVTAVALPKDAQLVREKNAAQDVGVHVAAKDEVSVYGLNRIKFTTDAFLGLPTDVLGTDYRVISYDPSFGTGPEASVVATADGTTVTITPLAGVPQTVQLDMGEAYQVESDPDLTGTRIVANKPVAAFGAHNCANVPSGAPFCDHLLEQLTPVDTWGRRFATMPLATRTGGDTFRILAAEPATTVKVNGATVATLGAGAHHEQLIKDPALIETSKPALVVQYSNGSTFDSTVSDPFMTIVPPTEQFQAAYTVSTPAAGFTVNYLNLVVPEPAKAGIVLDGAPVPAASFTTIGSSGYAGAQIPVELGSHRITSTVPFGVTVYGYDQDDSYGYGGGMALADVASVTQLGLTPASETLEPGSEGCVEAKGSDLAGVPVPDVRVDFSVTGTHPASGFAPTGADGVARYCWRGTKTGDDTVTASVGALSRTATKQWRERETVPPKTEEPVKDPPPKEEQQEVKGESATDLVLGCAEQMVVLEDVVPVGAKVRLVGVADRRFAGKTVSIVFVPSGKVVAKPKVAADGSFSATAPLPPKTVRNTNAARYEARIGAVRSLKLKLMRRMRITSIGVAGGKLVVSGTVIGPFAARKTDRTIELQRRVSCTKTERVAQALPRADGSFRIVVPVPAGTAAAVYRLRTKVRATRSSSRASDTFTLPRGVNF